MTLESLIQNYGYPVLLLGAFLEGETIVVIAGFAAHRGYLQLPWVILCALCGTFVSDQLSFYLGHKKGQSFLLKRPKWQRRAERVQPLLDRYQLAVILGFRFFYGLRNITPFLIGASGFRPRRFFFLNFAGAVLWAVLVATGGYLFGEVLQAVLTDVKKYERWVLLAVVLLGVGAVLIHRRLSRRAESREEIRDAPNAAPDDADAVTADKGGE